MNDENVLNLMVLKALFNFRVLRSEIMPIQIKNGLWILPISILQDQSFSMLHKKMINEKDSSLANIRFVELSEFIQSYD